ncbi:hypothetical protein [Rhizobium halophytocola]|uniref:Yip1 domain-containing protein n=1 Tax=Rhizobium halophytocola TaxID=735519 RepID=A0ABS4E059_9HYPH|nr:hypothetical protein [Rhizobium halophytocola]MBP1851321.1 hypothetical protein [Rhizobium halophytocola]
MPTLKEVELYLTGIWLLLKQDPGGFKYLDFTDRGAMRSFFAIVFALPAIGISWYWLMLGHLALLPDGASVGIDFFLRVAMIEAMNWILPLVLAGILAWTLGIGERFSAIVATTNWVTVPFTYLYAVLILLLMLLPAIAGLVAMIWLILMLAMVFVYMRVMQMLCGGQLLTAATMTTVLLIPSILVTELLERFLGITVG